MNKTAKRHALKNPDEVFIANMTGILLNYASFQQNSWLILKQKIGITCACFSYSPSSVSQQLKALLKADLRDITNLKKRYLVIHGHM